VGFALEDYSALCFMRDTAAELGIGEIIDLIPRTADPKNLFGMLLQTSPAAALLPEVVLADAVAA